MVFHIQEMETITWKTVQYFMSTKWKTLELENSTIFLPRKLKSLNGEIYNISCPRISKNPVYELRSGVHLPSRNSGTVFFGPESLMNPGVKLWNMLPQNIICSLRI